MAEQPNYYAVLPAAVRYDNRLSFFEKVLFSEISSLSDQKGFCWARNKYFANLYDMSEGHISAAIAHLATLGYIKVEIDRTEGNTRKIWNLLASAKVTEATESAIVPAEGYTEKSEDLCRKTSIPIPKNQHTYTEKPEDIYNNKVNNKLNNKKRERVHAPPSLALLKFKETFPEIKIDCDFNMQIHDPIVFTTKVQQAHPWLLHMGRCHGLSWMLETKKYADIIAGMHDDYTKQKTAKNDLQRNFQRHNYSPDILKNVFTNLDEVDFGGEKTG